MSLEELSAGSRDLHTGLQKIRRDLESRFLDVNDGYSKRMFPFSAAAEGRVDALKDQVQAGIRAFNEVKMYYGEGDEKYNAATNPLALGRPGSLEFFGVFKTFLTSYDVSCMAALRRTASAANEAIPMQLCRSQNKARDDAKAALDRRRLAERNRAAAMTPQTTGASAHTEVGAMDELHARLRMQGTPRTKRSDRRRARELPSTPSLDHFDMATFAMDDAADDDATGLSLADMAAKMLNQLEDGSPTPPPRRLNAPETIREEADSVKINVPEVSQADTTIVDPVEIPSTPDNRPDPASLITPPDKRTSDFPLGFAVRTLDVDSTVRLEADTVPTETFTPP